MNARMGLDLVKASRRRRGTYRSLHLEGRPKPAPFTILRELKHPGPLGVNQIMKIMAFGFPSDDDSCLLTLTTFAGVPLRSFRAGFVQRWDLHSDGEIYDDSLFTYSPRPVCCFSPNGGVLSFILNTGNGHMILVERMGDCTLGLVHTSHFCRVEFNSIKCSINETVDSYVALVSNSIQN